MRNHTNLPHQRRSPENRRRVVAALLRWYASHGRRLSWRLPNKTTNRPTDTNSPYRILVSEVMLQQTQVARVVEKYPEFLQRFPTLQRLASARQRDVVVAWRGMGYNNRAVRLHRLAQMVVETHGGRLPRKFDGLMNLPGVGRYTANALLSSAFGAHVPVVDVNVRRVLSRIFRRMRSTVDVMEERDVWKLAEDLLPKGKAYHWNQALMDLGATVCAARSPLCQNCPVRHVCASCNSMRSPGKRTPPSEPSVNGVPDRIYRGRIVDALRENGGRRSIRVGVLGKTIDMRSNTRRLALLLRGLRNDGVIQMKGNGAFERRRISLA